MIINPPNCYHHDMLFSFSFYLFSERKKKFVMHPLSLEQVVDGLESFYKQGCFDKINSIRQSMSGKTHTVVFSDCYRHACVRGLQNLLMGSVHRLSLNNSVTGQSACIVQSVNICLMKEKLPKVCI